MELPSLCARVDTQECCCLIRTSAGWSWAFDTSFADYGFCLREGKPTFLWNLIDLKRIKWEGPEALSSGRARAPPDTAKPGRSVIPGFLVPLASCRPRESDRQADCPVRTVGWYHGA